MSDFKFPGQYELDGILVVGNSGVPTEISNLVQEISIYQSLDTPYMSGSLLLNDADDLSSSLPFLGNERLLFGVRTPGRKKIDFNTHQAVIYNVNKRTQRSDTAQTVIVQFTTLDNYINSFSRISKYFSRTISEIVEEILRSPNYLGTKKHVDIDRTAGIKKFIVPNLNPFQTIHTLQREAVSAEEDSSNYLFYENTDGYHFKSLDSLYGKQRNLVVAPKATYVYQHPASALGTNKNNPEGSLETILHWQIHDSTNSFVNIKTGMYASTLLTHDIFNKNVQKFEYNYENNYYKRNSTNMNKKGHGPIVALTNVKDNQPITKQYQSRTFLHPSGHEVYESSSTNSSNKEKLLTEGGRSQDWLQEMVSRYVERIENFKLTIETYGNTDLTVGDIIEVIIPANKPLPKSAGTDLKDRVLSGRYVISELHNLIQPGNKIHTMFMTVMKDSFENRQPDVETEYKAVSNEGVSYGGQRVFI